MTAIERRYQHLLRAYPRWYRDLRGDEMLGTLMSAGPARRWPSPRDTWALITGGLRVRAGQDQRLTTRANLRLAALLGVALSLIWVTASELAVLAEIRAYAFSHNPAGTALTYLVLALATVAAAWFAPWWATAPLALATAGFWLAWNGYLVMALQPVLLLVLLAALARGQDRLPRSWLVLAGAVFVVSALQGLASEPGLAFFQTPVGLVPAGLATLAAWTVFGLVVLWAVVDARPVLAMAVYLVSNYLITTLLGYAAGWGVVPIASWQVWLPAAAAAALALGGTWRVRRQALL
jgi:hypothetical protein